MRRNEGKAGTLGSVLRQNSILRLFCCKCPRCVDHDPAAVAALAGRYGADLPLQAFLERSRCAACGARWPSVDLQTPPNLLPGTGMTAWLG